MRQSMVLVLLAMICSWSSWYRNVFPTYDSYADEVCPADSAKSKFMKILSPYLTCGDCCRVQTVSAEGAGIVIRQDLMGSISIMKRGTSAQMMPEYDADRQSPTVITVSDSPQHTAAIITLPIHVEEAQLHHDAAVGTESQPTDEGQEMTEANAQLMHPTFQAPSTAADEDQTEAYQDVTFYGLREATSLHLHPEYTSAVTTPAPEPQPSGEAEAEAETGQQDVGGMMAPVSQSQSVLTIICDASSTPTLFEVVVLDIVDKDLKLRCDCTMLDHTLNQVIDELFKYVVNIPCSELCQTLC